MVYEKVKLQVKDFLRKTTKLLLGMDVNEMIQSRAARDVTGSLVLRIVNRLLQIGLAILIARILPLKEFGLYSLVMAWVVVLSVPALVGTPQFVQREIAVAKSRKQWGKLKGIFRWSTHIVLTGSSVISAVAICCVFAVMSFLNPERVAFLLGFIFIPATVLAQLWQAQLRGWGAILAGQVPDAIIRPVLFALILLLAVTLAPSIGVSATSALLIQGVVVLVVLGVTAALKFRHVQIPEHTLPEMESWIWLRLSSWFTLLSGLAILNNQIGILMVGAISGKSDAGLFTVAVKGADSLIVGFAAANMALAPRMAAFYHERKLEKLQAMILRTYRAVALLTLPVLLIFIFWGNHVLMVFGSEYVIAWPVLVVLSSAQFVNVLAGPVGNMLSMAGHERVTAFGVAVSVLVIVGLGLILIPTMGILGAAIATATGMVTWNVLLVALCYKRLGIWTPVIGIGFVRTMRKRN